MRCEAKKRDGTPCTCKTTSSVKVAGTTMQLCGNHRQTHAEWAAFKPALAHTRIHQGYIPHDT